MIDTGPGAGARGKHAALGASRVPRLLLGNCSGVAQKRQVISCAPYIGMYGMYNDTVKLSSCGNAEDR